MKLPRRKFLHLAAGAAALPAMPHVAMALDYPTHTVRLVVGFPAGLAPDITARIVGQGLSERLGQQVIVDNRPGAGSNIAAEAVVRAPADGYTLLLVTITNAVNATLYRGLNFDLARDIAPIAGTFRSPLLMVVNPSLPVKTVPEFIAYAKANPGKINYASPGFGTANNMAGELFKVMTGVDLVHVPYRGSYMPDLLAGQVQATFAAIVTVIEFIRAGKLRLLAVTGPSRVDALPGIPSVAEFVPGFEYYIWHGIGAPRGTPSDVINKLNAEIDAVLADPNTKARFAEVGGTVIGGTPVDFGKLIADETDKWAKVIRTANIKPE
jgi:tripartite-type tricarboxylate transporter receptor subunit TctC